jgi:ParB family transcriptional regulator, chromosome partitioning protein
MAKQALGKGLGALIGGGSPQSSSGGAIAKPAAPPAEGEAVLEVPISMVVPSPLQPRATFTPQHLEELVNSIREHGIIQPLIVRKFGTKYELIAGERRWRASGELGLEKVPVIVRTASDKDVLEMALIENLQREDLNPIEEARAYARLAKEFKMRQEEIADRVGKNRATVANSIRLLDLSAEVQGYIEEKRIAVGHAKVLLGIKTKTGQTEAAREVIEKGLTVRATEKLVANLVNPEPPRAKAPDLAPQVAAAVESVESRLRAHLTSNVRISHTEKRGKIEIEYYGTDDLNRVLSLLGVEEESAFD